MNSAEQLQAARQNLETAQRAWADALFARYPMGADVLIRRCERARWQRAKVDRHGCNGDIRVHVETGHLFWIRHDNHWGQLKLVEES